MENIKQDIKKILNSKKKVTVFIILATLISLIYRIMSINYMSDDYVVYLNDWFSSFKYFGGFNALKENVGNYNIPYQVILAALSYLPFKPLFMIKFVSIVFDYILAVVCALIVKQINVHKGDDINILPAITYALVIFIPTVILNSSSWAQCDSIYTAFVFLSLYYMSKNRSVLSFIFLGIAFSFKLQFIFILPLYLLTCLKVKKFNIFEFLIVPLVNYVMCIPAFIHGRSFLDVSLIYFKQIYKYKSLSKNISNIYTFIPNNSKTIMYIRYNFYIFINTFYRYIFI